MDTTTTIWEGKEKSNGHLKFWGQWELFVGSDGDIYRAKYNTWIDTESGYRGGRWERPARDIGRIDALYPDFNA